MPLLTCCHWSSLQAAANPDPAVAKLLLEAKADPCARDVHGRCPLGTALLQVRVASSSPGCVHVRRRSLCMHARDLSLALHARAFTLALRVRAASLAPHAREAPLVASSHYFPSRRAPFCHAQHTPHRRRVVGQRGCGAAADARAASLAASGTGCSERASHGALACHGHLSRVARRGLPRRARRVRRRLVRPAERGAKRVGRPDRRC